MCNETVVHEHGFAQRNRKDKMMVQVAAALLFAIAAGLGITVILAMLKTNENAILSSLLGEGAFPMQNAPHPGPATNVVKLRQRGDRRDAPRPVRLTGGTALQLSRAA